MIDPHCRQPEAPPPPVAALPAPRYRATGSRSPRALGRPPQSCSPRPRDAPARSAPWFLGEEGLHFLVNNFVFGLGPERVPNFCSQLCRFCLGPERVPNVCSQGFFLEPVPNQRWTSTKASSCQFLPGPCRSLPLKRYQKEARPSGLPRTI